MDPLTFRPIGKIHSPFGNRFGIPRQSGLVPSAEFVIALTGEGELDLASRGIEKFSHLWVLFHFHDLKAEWRPLVAPPRLGGRKKVGTFASRSPYRPNPIGMSAVEFVRCQKNLQGIMEIVVRGGDFQEGTPVLDIKPYVPYADMITTARADWAETEERPLTVEFTPEVDLSILELDPARGESLRLLIVETLALDPRPGYERRKPCHENAYWGTILMGYDVKWRVDGDRCLVFHLENMGISAYS
jgi:tRNA-Thr(GGU) m(6)t(6)A37 methyltransferase TsaA